MKAQKNNIMQRSSATLSLLLFAVLFSFSNLLFAQSAPTILWQKCLGGTQRDVGYSIIQTFDGGYAAVGWTTTINSADGDVQGTHTDTTGTHGYVTADIWFVKLNSSGTIEWQKCLGGKGEDRPGTVLQTPNSGFIIAGYSNSIDGDVSGLHIDTTVNKFLQDDAWIVKLSSTGNIDWKKCIGGIDGDGASSIIATFGGGYLFTGSAGSHDGDLSFPHHGQLWICKLSDFGNIEWQNCFGGTDGQDFASTVIQTPDSGYAIAGYTSSSNKDVVGQHGIWTSQSNLPFDGWVVKLSQSGKLQWQKCLGGTDHDVLRSILQTSDHGYIVTGTTASVDGDVSGHHHPDTTIRETDTIISGKGNYDAWVVKLDSSGNIQWQKCLGGHENDGAGPIIQTSDGGYIFLGYTTSTDGDVSGLHGQQADAWLVKLNSSGNILWQKCYGGTNEEYGNSLLHTSDNGFIFAGTTRSTDGDVSGLHGKTGFEDIWVVKLSAASGVQENSSYVNSPLTLITYPNPASKNITFGYDLPKASAVGITVYNVIGEKIQEIQQKEEESGHQEVSLELSGFSAGSYFIEVKACGKVESTKVEVLK